MTSEIPLVQDGFHAWSVPASRRPLAQESRLGTPEVADVERRAADWEIAQLDRPGWRRLTLSAGRIYGDVEIPVLRRLGAYLEDFDGMYRRSGIAATLEGPYVVRIFKRTKDFCAYAACIGAANAQSLYNPRTQEIGLWFDESEVSLSWLEEIFAHEVTHAWMDLGFRRTGPLWFAEGMAVYFASFQWDGDIPVPGQVKDQLVRLARLERMPLARLIQMPRDEMYGPEWPRLYALSWSVVHYLQTKVPELVVRLLRGEGNIPPPEALDRAWWTYVEGL
jgi:hypothetical protein